METERKEIFVFGSNEGGHHGAGAAYHAHRHYGAEWGIGEGLTGLSFAIPTKDKRIKTLPLSEIKIRVDRFIGFAKERQDLDFFVTRIGCGLAGYVNEEIAPFFTEAPNNCIFDSQWEPFLPGKKFREVRV